MLASLLLVIAVFVPLERLFASRRQKFLREAFWTDLGYYFVSGLVPKIMLIAPMSLLAIALHRTVPLGYYAFMGSVAAPIRLMCALVVGEIGYYWGHRWLHAVPVLWRFHAIHHQAERMDWLVNTRAHPIDLVFGRLCSLVPIYVLGVAQPTRAHPDMVPVLFALIGSLWGFFVHANLNWRLGWLEAVVSTPAFHHWHHSDDGPEFVGKNFSTMLPWVDRLFGTFYLPPGLPATYGIGEVLPPNLLSQLVHPFLRERPSGTPPSGTPPPGATRSNAGLDTKAPSLS